MYNRGEKNLLAGIFYMKRQKKCGYAYKTSAMFAGIRIDVNAEKIRQSRFFVTFIYITAEARGVVFQPCRKSGTEL